MMEAGGRSFYLAISRDELYKPWFLSAYLKQHLPGQAAEGAGASSLGIRVVTFRIANDRLYLLDVDERKRSSDVFDPELLVEAFPIITGYPAFEKLPNAGDYVLIDPAAGLNQLQRRDRLRPSWATAAASPSSWPWPSGSGPSPTASPSRSCSPATLTGRSPTSRGSSPRPCSAPPGS